MSQQLKLPPGMLAPDGYQCQFSLFHFQTSFMLMCWGEAENDGPCTPRETWKKF